MSTLMLRAFAALVSRLSWSSAQRLGRALGALWFHVLRIRRKTVAKNLKMALSERSDHGVIAKASYLNTTLSAVELIRLRTMTHKEMEPLICLKGIENYEKALSKNKGVIVVTAHLGNFDMLACSQAARGVPLAIVSRELSDRGSNRFWMDARERHGLRIFKERTDARDILRWLRAGKVLGVVTDQRTRSERGGTLSPFMGAKVWTTTAPARLAMRTGAAILPTKSVRLPDGTHAITVFSEIPLSCSKVKQAAVLETTDEINGVIESWVRENPEQWMWLHRRFEDAQISKPELE